MIQTAENVAQRYRIARDAQDAYALESQRRTAAAQDAGRFDAEIVPFDVTQNLVDKQGQITGTQAITLAKRRRQSTRHDARRPREAEAGDGRRRRRHRGQLEPAVRRRVGVRADERAPRRAARPAAARHLSRLRGRRLRARRDGHRPGVRGAAPVEAPRPERRRHRPVGAERSLRGAGAVLPRPAAASRTSGSTSTAARSRSATRSA